MKKLILALLTLASSHLFAQQVINLNPWKFSTGDNLEWAKPNFDDSKWDTIRSGLTCHMQGYEYHEGYAWYRIRFHLSSQMKKKVFFKDSLRILLGKINRCDQTFLNGALIGENASLRSAKAPLAELAGMKSAGDKVRDYTLPVTDPRILWDRDNVLAIRVYVNPGLGGMFTGATNVSMKDIKDYLLFDTDSPLEYQEDGSANKMIAVKNLSPASQLKGKLIMEIKDDATGQVIKTQARETNLGRGRVTFETNFRTGFSQLLKATYTFVEESSGSKAVFEQVIPCIDLASSDPRLDTAFSFARKTAIGFARWNDPVGKCYEAAIPGFNGFCMRDVAHQTKGAYYLGLGEYNKNMLSQFAANQSPFHGWMSSWHIPYQGVPANYKEICDHWNPLFELPFELPANFDVTSACYDMFNISGDPDYLFKDPFYSFHYHNVHEYVKYWDPNHDGIMESPKRSIQAISTNMEYIKTHISTGADMVAAQARGYTVFGHIMALKGEADSAAFWFGEADKLRKKYEQDWWDKKTDFPYCFIDDDGQFNDPSIDRGMAVWAGITAMHQGLVHDEARIRNILPELTKERPSEEVEANSYVPLVLFQYDQIEPAYKRLLAMVDPSVRRRNYPEVPYTFINTTIEGLMGIEYSAAENLIETTPKLPEGLDWVRISHIPWKTGTITVKYNRKEAVTLTNASKRPFSWKAVLPGTQEELWMNDQWNRNRKLKAKTTTNFKGEPMTYVEIVMFAGETIMISKQPIRKWPDKVL